MKTRWFAMIFLGLTIASSNPAVAQNLAKIDSKDTVAIKQLALDLDATWNKYDAVAFSALFIDEADFQYWDGAVLKNRKEIEQYYSTQVFKNMQPGMRHTSTLQRIRFIKQDFAIGDGTLVITREGASENEKPALSALFTSIAQKKDGQWHIAAVRLMFPSSR